MSSTIFQSSTSHGSHNLPGAPWASGPFVDYDSIFDSNAIFPGVSADSEAALIDPGFLASVQSAAFTDIGAGSDSWIQLTEVPDWPNGKMQVIVSWDEAKTRASGDKSWHANGWAWESRGKRYVEKYHGMVTFKKCLGVFLCSDPSGSGCVYVLRPRTKGEHKTQLTEICPQCQTVLRYKDCSIKSFIVDCKETETETWLHEGIHYHPRPTWGHINRRTQNAIRGHILENPRATPTQLQRVRSMAPSGTAQTAIDINPKYTNRSAIRYEANKILNAGNILSKTAKSADQFILRIQEIQDNDADWVKVVSLKRSAEVIVLQSSFMISCLNQMLVSTSDQNGYITDAAHGFFEIGLMLVTVGFMPNMLQWMPVMISWIGSNTAECYEIHFKHLMKSIKKAVPSMTDDQLSNVVDFSEAQSKGFKNAFVSFTQDNLLHKLLEGKDITETPDLDLGMYSRKTLESRAAACLKGCEYHFKKNVIKVKRNTVFVPYEKADEFSHLIDVLLTCDDETFGLTLRQILKTFPSTRHWLEWWTDTRVASKLFACKRTMSSVRAEQLPTTSNAVESVHRQIYAACKIRPGERFNVIVAIHALRDYDKVNQSLSKNCNEGYKLSYGKDQERSRHQIETYGPGASRGRKKPIGSEHNNDGRPSVDTAERLAKAQRLDQKSNSLTNTTFFDGIRLFPKSRTYQSSPWQDNLCYLDVLIEVFYFVYNRDQSYWNSILIKLEESVEHWDCPLKDFLQAMKERYQIYEEATQVDKLQEALLTNRNHLASAFDIASILTLGSFGSATTLWHQIVLKSKLPPEIDSIFQSVYVTFRLCQANHVETIGTHKFMEFLLPLTTNAGLKKRVDASDALRAMLRTQSVPQHMRSSTCTKEGCNAHAVAFKVAISVPKIMIVEENIDTSETRPAHLSTRYVFPEDFDVLDGLASSLVATKTQIKRRKIKQSTGRFVMAGKILYHPTTKHYTAIVRTFSKPEVFEYDDQRLNPNGALRTVGGGAGLAIPANSARASVRGASQMLTKVTADPCATVYILDNDDEIAYDIMDNLESWLDSLGLYLHFNQELSQYTVSASTAKRTPKETKSVQQLRSKLFEAVTVSTERQSDDSSMSNTSSDDTSGLTGEHLSENDNSLLGSSINVANCNKHAVRSQSSCEESLSDVKTTRRQKPKPSYEYVLMPADQPAKKEFIATELPLLRKRHGSYVL